MKLLEKPLDNALLNLMISETIVNMQRPIFYSFYDSSWPINVLEIARIIRNTHYMILAVYCSSTLCYLMLTTRKSINYGGFSSPLLAMFYIYLRHHIWANEVMNIMMRVIAADELIE